MLIHQNLRPVLYRLKRIAHKSVHKAFLFRLRTTDWLFKRDVHISTEVSSDTPIDIFIPLGARHLSTLPFVIKGARKYIRHPVLHFFVVSNNASSVKDLCKQLDVTFVDELDVLGYDKHSIEYRCRKGQDRAGWLYQQLLKLHADRVSDQNKILVLDAGTVFVRPKIFCHQGQDILDYSDEWHLPYFSMYKRMMDQNPLAKVSFVCNYMLFDRDKLIAMKAEVLKKHHKQIDAVIIELIDRAECSGFSEFETYGNYVLNKWPTEIKREYWFHRHSDLLLTSSITGFVKSVSWE